MKREDELALNITREIVVKFIEREKISVNTFGAGWKNIYTTVRNSLNESEPEPEDVEPGNKKSP